MSDTSRTDESFEAWGFAKERFMPLPGEPSTRQYVLIEFARTLERELAAAQAKISEQQVWMQEMVEKAAGGGVLDGYRELGSKCAALEETLDARNARIAELERDLSAAQACIAKIEHERDALRAAAERVLVGGNHLASLIGNHPPAGMPLEQVRAHYLPQYPEKYEAWLCWNTIMHLRDVMEGE